MTGASQNNSGKPSIAAVVGSVDPRASQYCCEIRIQKSEEVIIKGLNKMVVHLLRKIKYKHGKADKPMNLIFFRECEEDDDLETVKLF